MPKVVRTLEVSARPDEVIEYIADVTHHIAFISPLNAVTDVGGDPRELGTRWSWSYTMAGVELHGDATTTEYAAGRNFSFRTGGGIGSSFRYEVEPAADGTRLTVEVEYQMPDTVLAKLVDTVALERMNEGVADTSLRNLKAIFES